MSWLNNSLNTLKGQITNFAQEVLAEGPEDEEVNPYTTLENTQKENEEFQLLCTEKDNEISTLRKQIQELQAKHVEAGRSSKSPLEKNGSLEDSWCWEPENLPSSDSSTKNDNGGATSDSSTGGDMITIPLDSTVPKETGFVVAKLSKRSDEKDQKLKKLLTENSMLNEKIHNLILENNQLNGNLEELDNQHTIAIQNVLELKTDLQEKYNHIKIEYDTLKENHNRTVNDLQNQLKTLQTKFEDIFEQYKHLIEENENLKFISKEENDNIKELKLKNNDLKQEFEIKQTEFQDLIKKISSEKEVLIQKNHELENFHNIEKSCENSTEKETTHLEKELETLQVRFKEIENEKNVLEIKLNKLTQEKQHVLNDFVVMQQIDTQDALDMEDQNDKLRNEYDTIKTEFLNLQRHSDSLQKELKDQINDLEKEISEQKIKNKICSEEIDLLKEINQDAYNNLLHEKERIEIDLKITQENFFRIEQEKESLREELQLKFLEKNDKDNKESLENVITKLKSQIDELNQSKNDFEIQKEKYLIEINELNENLKKCEANASDVETKLMMENVDLQKQLIDFESSINKNNIEKNLKNLLTFDEIQCLFNNYLKFDEKITDKDSLEKQFQIIHDRIWKIEILEKNLKEMSNEVTHLIEEKSTIEHEKKTLQADLMHYEIECSDLMKNNEILLNELENYKRNKLETIHENNEEGIIMLEKQLEDSNILNRTLEDEYNEINSRLEDIEQEKKNNQIQIESFQEIIKNLNITIHDMQKKIELLETDKCNLIFEINEMKTDDKKSAMESEIFEYKNKITNLENQLERLNKDHSDLVSVMQTQQNTLLDNKKESEKIIIKLEKQLKENETINVDRENVLKKLKFDMNLLQTKVQQQKTIEDDKEIDIINDKILQLKLENDLLQENSSKLFEENRKLEEIITNLKITNETINDNIKELNERNEDLNNLLKGEESKLNNHLKTIAQQNERLADLQNQLTRKVSVDETNIDETIQLKQTIEQLTRDKNDLIQSVTIKHNETTNYYMEIQRLGQLLQNEMEKSKILGNCENCMRLQNDLTTMSSLHLNEMEKLKDQINFLREKSDILTSNLLSEQTNQKLLQQEKIEIVEQNGILKKDLERLRQHLVELEEAHTHETLEMQTILDATKANMNTLQAEVAKSSNAYTSANIRANQHAETLQTQYILLTQQRDEIATKLSLAEDRESKNQAALVNLQCALEQFQKEKEKDILTETHRLRREFELEQDKQKQLLNTIENLQQKLTDANLGLLAAARLSDQLEVNQVTIAALKDEIGKLQEKNQILDEKLETTQLNQEDKIEKNLVKSLIIGYVVSSNQNDKSQVLKVISSVLDFNQTEIDRIGINKANTGWFSGILHGGNNTNSSSSSDSQYNLAKAFVNFLENESRPAETAVNMPNLLNIINETTELENSRSNETSKLAERKLSGPSNIQPILLNENVMNQFAPSRNSSSILKDILNDS